jgi:hypothetical protein
LKTALWIAWLCFCLALTLATRCANHADIFVGGKIYFVDADCYSRMTRVREVLAHPRIISHHDFENYPQGTTPHTTAPMDFLIAGLAFLLKPFRADYVDFAGAIISPLLGVLTTLFLAFWARELMTQRYRRVMLFLVSISPILVHGTALGRPDHQSLLIFLMAVALGAELAMAHTPTVRWGVIAGVAWSLGIWVSLYEPLVLLGTVWLTKIIFYRPQLFARQRLPGHIVFVVILGLALLLEGWRIMAPEENTRHYLRNWLGTIGEITPMWKISTGGILRSLLFTSVGFGLFLAPLLLVARLRDTKRSVLLLALFVVTLGFTLMQARWGYFFALVFALSLPWQLSLFKKPAIVWSLFLLSLWPMAAEWKTRLFPDDARKAALASRRFENAALRDVAERLRPEQNAGQKIPVLAPWWISPALAYWANQPCVAGSSHESLPGIVDSARFFLTPDLSSAGKILKNRAVGAVVITDAQNVVNNSSRILGQIIPPHSMAQMLWERPHSAAPKLLSPGTIENPLVENLFKIFIVKETVSTQ